MRLVSLVLGFCLTVISAAHAEGGGTAEIYGVVKDSATGQPLPGVQLILTGFRLIDKGLPRDTVESGPDGSFRFTGLAPTTDEDDGYELSAKPDRYEYVYAFRIQLAAGEKKRLDFACGRIFTLTVSVHDSGGSSAPLRGAHVVLDRKRGIVSTDLGEADPLGEVGFVGMKIGSVGLTVALEGYRTRYLNVALDGSNWEESLSVSLERAPDWEGKRVRGTLKNQYGDPWIGREIWFSCVTPDARPVLFALTGDGGEYAISGIPEGCVSGALHPFAGRDSLMISYLHRETEAYYIQKATGILEGARQRKPVIAAAGGRFWHLDYTASGRKKRVR